MRFLVLTPYFYPHPGGSQQYIEELYVSMRKLKPNLEVDIICYNTNHAPKIESYRGLTIYRVGCIEILPGQFALPNYLEMFQLIRSLKKSNKKYTILNAHTRFFDSAWWAPLAAKYLQAIPVLTDHCAELPTHPSKFVTFITKMIDRLWVPIIARQYKKITAVSIATQRYLSDLGVQKASVVYPGVDTTLFKPGRHSSQKIQISFVGRLIPSKGAQLFVSAAQPLLKKHSNIQITVAGDGPLLDSIKAQETERISVPGRLNRQEVAQLLKKSDIFVLPSTHHEGFPITLLEAGASHAAIITTNQGGTSEIIQNGKTGILISPTVRELQQALEKMITDEVFRKKVATQLYQKVENDFSWEKSARMFLTALHLW